MKARVGTLAVMASVAVVSASALAGQLRVRESGMYKAEKASAGLRARTKSAAGFDAASAAAKAVVALSERLGIAATAEDLRVRCADADAFGRTHVRIQQLFGGVEVDGRELIVHFDAAGSVYEVNGDWLDTSSLAAFPAPSAKVAGATLVVYCKGDDAAAARLAWRRRRGRYIVFSDAQSGETIHVRRASPHAFPDDDDDEEEDDGLDLDSDRIILFANELELPAGAATTVSGNLPPQQGGKAVVVGATLDTNGVARLVTTTADGIEVGVLDGIASPSMREDVKAADAAKLEWTNEFLGRTGWTGWSEDAAEDMPNALAIMYNVTTVLDYYKSAFNRRSYDNQGGRVASWRFWQDDGEDLDIGYGNAFWSALGEEGAAKEKGCFFFGYRVDGTASETSLDTCAHELTHGITAWTANLHYEAESGALNESFSDLIGASCEFAAQPRAADLTNPNPGEADWLFDEDSGKAIRSFAEPGLYGQPSRYKGKKWVKTSDTSEQNDHGGVHDNSGVQNHFFYLLCEGGKGVNDGVEYDLKGIGIEKCAQLAYLTLTAYCGPRTDYAAVVGCWDSAAQDLLESGVLTDEDYAAVAPAWAAVMGDGGEFSAVGENAFAATNLEDGYALVVKTGKANAKGLFKTTGTLYQNGKLVALFSGPKTSGPEVTLKNRRYGELKLSLAADSATGYFGDDANEVKFVSIAPEIEEVDEAAGLCVGVAVNLPLAMSGEAVKASWSSRGLPRGVKCERNGILSGVPSATGEGAATVSARCTVAVPGLARKIIVNVARKVDWSVSPIDDYAQGKFVGQGLSITVSPKGRVSGYAKAGGSRFWLSAKSYSLRFNGGYAAEGTSRGREWGFAVDAEGAAVEIALGEGEPVILKAAKVGAK